MDARLFSIDPYALSSYGMYNAAKKGEGDFVDFLLHYDSKSLSEGDNSWFSKVVGEDVLSKINSTEMAQALHFANFNTFDLLKSQSYFDTQVSAYKLQLQLEASKRGVELPVSTDVLSSLYM